MANNTEDTFVARSIAAQKFGDYLQDSDTDTDNASLPRSRRWVWVCKLEQCLKHGTAWTCKTNFLLHLFETAVHQDDDLTKSRTGRRQICGQWREERAFDFSDMPRGFDLASTQPIDLSDYSETARDQTTQRRDEANSR